MDEWVKMDDKGPETCLNE